jgi:hypothetical protein
VAVLYLGQSDALKGLFLAGLGMAGKPGEPIEGMQTLLIGNAAGVAYDDKVMIIGQPLEQLTWSVKQYKGATAEPTLASQNTLFARLSRKNREENAVTIWLDGAATFAAISQQMGGGGAAQLKLVDGVADFNSLREVIASVSIGEQSIGVQANVGLKDGHKCLAYDLIRTPNLSRAGFEAVPPEAVAVVSLALGELQAAQTEKAQEVVRNLTGLDIGREIFANIEQVTLFALPPGAASKDSPLARRLSPIVPCLGLAVTSHNPQKTHQLLNQLLTVAGLITDVSAGGQSGKEAEQLTGKYKIGVVDDKPAYCYMEQVGRTTIVALSPEVLQACLSAAKTRQSALTAGPLKESLDQLPAETSKLVLVNVAGAIRSADSYLSWEYDNPKNPGHRLLDQLAQALDETTVYLRTGEQLNSFNLHAGVEQMPPLGGVFPIAMQLSQTDLQAKARATEPRPSDGAVVTPGAEVRVSWKPGANTESHKLYFATQADELSLVDEVTEPAYANVPRPQRDKTYYWRVDEVQTDGSVIEGDVWSFNTGKLVAWWKFDETSGTKVADSAGSGYDGTVVHGEPVWDPNGKYEGCLNFDETYGFSIPKEIFSSINTSVTVSVWVKSNEKQREHSDVILQAGAGDDGKPYIVSIYTDWLDYGLKFATGFGEPDRLEFNPGAPEDWAGGWNHYAFVKDADKGFQRIYLNGSLVAEKTDATASMSGVGAARIGIAPDRFGDQHIGKLDDLRIYNYALSEQEIAALCPMPKASGVPPAQLGFGPVRERTVMDGGTYPQTNCFIDFESGQLIGAPPQDRETEPNEQRWLDQTGADARGHAESRDSVLVALHGLYMALIPVDNSLWDDCAPEAVKRQLASARSVPLVAAVLQGEAPSTYMFRTRDGGMGLLQVLEVKANEYTKIRYKMLQKPYTQKFYADIAPDGALNFETMVRKVNESGAPVKRTSFVNSDFVKVTAMHGGRGQPIQFTTVLEGDHWRYRVTFNEPVAPGGMMVYSQEGTMSSLIKAVPGEKDTFQYYMRHYPSAGRPTLRIETYLLPDGAELLSTTPADMQRRKKDGRIELHVEETIPPGGSITTAFKYRLPGAQLSWRPEKMQTTEMRRVFLPECDTTVYDLLDLASGQIINSEPNGQMLDVVDPNGEGDVYYDYSDGQYWLVTLRGGRMRLRTGHELGTEQPQFVSHGIAAYYMLGVFPSQYQVTTGTGEKHELKVLSVEAAPNKRRGITLEYWKADEPTGSVVAVPAEQAEAKDEIAAKHRRRLADNIAEMGWDLRKLDEAERAGDLSKSERLDKVEEMFKKALQTDPANARALRGLAVTYMQRKEYDEAIKCYEMWLKAEPDNPDAKAGLEKAKAAKQQ